jgi:hypothetical protein
MGRLKKVEVKKEEMVEEQGEEDFKCIVCLENFIEDNIMPMSGCEHLFHMDCLQLFAKSEIDSGKSFIKCPDERCKSEINEQDLK